MRAGILRLFYSSTFSLLFLLLVALLLILPADVIYQSYVNNELWNVVVIGGIYVLTFLVAAFIYATRLYTTRTHLASIPKSYVPIRRGDLNASIRRLVARGLKRSATIAYETYPRNVKQDQNHKQPSADSTEKSEVAEEKQKQKQKQGPDAEASSTNEKASSPGPNGPNSLAGAGVDAETDQSRGWASISHPGWSSPASLDLPHLQFEPVILEIAHLLEAKAVSLAPQDPSMAATATAEAFDTALPDPAAVSLLQRPSYMPIRAYLDHLSALHMIQPPELESIFLRQYEEARFGGRPLSETSFRQLLSTFATLLENMQPPDPGLMTSLTGGLGDESGGSFLSSARRSLRSSRSSGSSSLADSIRKARRQSSTLRVPRLSSLDPQKRRTKANATSAITAAATAASAASAAAVAPNATPFFTPFLAPTHYPASLSSGHAGDRSSDSASIRSVHTTAAAAAAATAASSGTFQSPTDGAVLGGGRSGPGGRIKSRSSSQRAYGAGLGLNVSDRSSLWALDSQRHASRAHGGDGGEESDRRLARPGWREDGSESGHPRGDHADSLEEEDDEDDNGDDNDNDSDTGSVLRRRISATSDNDDDSLWPSGSSAVSQVSVIRRDVEPGSTPLPLPFVPNEESRR